IREAAGRESPTSAATAPSAPAIRSPISIAIFTVFSPGSVWLIVKSSTKAASSIHRRFPTTAFLRCATTPPPKLVAPITRNARKISCSRGRGASFVSVDRMALQAVNETGLGGAKRDPAFDVALQRDEELFDELLGFRRHFSAVVEL